MIFLTLFTLLLTSFTIAYIIVYLNIDNKINDIIYDIITELQSLDCTIINRINTVLTSIQQHNTNHLIIIFIIPILSYFFFIIVIIKLNMEESFKYVYLLFGIKILFCCIILFINFTNKNLYYSNITKLEEILTDDLSVQLKPHIDDIKGSIKEININYNIVYSIEIILTSLFILILYKYQDILDLLNI